MIAETICFFIFGPFNQKYFHFPKKYFWSQISKKASSGARRKISKMQCAKNQTKKYDALYVLILQVMQRIEKNCACKMKNKITQRKTRLSFSSLTLLTIST
jgi:hypothetical protein